MRYQPYSVPPWLHSRSVKYTASTKKCALPCAGSDQVFVSPANSPLKTKPTGLVLSIGPNCAVSRYSPVAANGSVPLALGQAPFPPGTGNRNHPKFAWLYGAPFTCCNAQRVLSVAGGGLEPTLA